MCKACLANLRDDYEAAKLHVECNGLGLENDAAGSGEHGCGGGPGVGRGGGGKERLLSNADSLHPQDDTLAKARSIMAETEGVTLEITEELDRH